MELRAVGVEPKEGNKVNVNLSATEMNLDWLRARRLIRKGQKKEPDRMNRTRLSYISE